MGEIEDPEHEHGDARIERGPHGKVETYRRREIRPAHDEQIAAGVDQPDKQPESERLPERVRGGEHEYESDGQGVSRRLRG